MTKKTLVVCMLILACTMSGCWFTDWLRSIFGTDFCVVDGPPNTPFLVIYPDGSRRRSAIGGTGHGTFDKTSPNGNRISNCNQCIVDIGNNSGFALAASPSSADLNSVPPSVTISGQAMAGTYGMPLVEYFDIHGYLVGSTSASAVADDGSWLTTPTPDLSSVYSGTYQIRVTNRRWDGEYLDIVGTATLSCYGRDRPDSDGDGYYDDEDCYPNDPNRWSCGGGGGGCGGSYGVTLPPMECEVY